MTEASPPRLERALGVALSLLAALIAITCGSRGTLGRAPTSPALSSHREPPQAVPSASLAPSPLPPDAVADADADAGLGFLPISDPDTLPLPHFFSDLRGLEQKLRDSAVRIVWLGDSHTAADYLTGALRTRLQEHFGAGGPGFVRVGVKPYRHTQLHFSFDGPWKIEPIPPPRRTPFDDGVFALGGLRALPNASPAHAWFGVKEGAARGRLRFQLWFSVKGEASFKVTLGGASQIVNSGSRIPELPGAGFASLSLSSGLSDKFELTTLAGTPRFYGLVAEGSEPGLVLDAVGIDGARVATALAWGEASFEAALRARAPSLVVLAFGTNEAFDADKLDTYRAQYQALLARVRVAASEADCLLVGPPDALAVAGGSEPRVAAIDALQRSIASELGCGYVSQLSIMGGAGSYARWAAQSPALARGDRLHLTPKGYEVVGDAIGDRLLEAYGRTVR